MKTQACTAAVGVLLDFSMKMDKLRLRELNCRCAYVQGELLERQLARIHEEELALGDTAGVRMEEAMAGIFSVGYQKAAQLPEQEGAQIIPTLQKMAGDIAFLLEHIMTKFENMPALAMGAGYMEIFKELDEYLVQLEQA